MGLAKNGAKAKNGPRRAVESIPSVRRGKGPDELYVNERDFPAASEVHVDQVQPHIAEEMNCLSPPHPQRKLRDLSKVLTSHIYLFKRKHLLRAPPLR